jgi:hypothetical protein
VVGPLYVVEIFLYRVIEVRHEPVTGLFISFPNSLGILKRSHLLNPRYSFFFDVHILKGTPGLFSNPEVKLERVYGVVTWETSGEMCMTSNFSLFF